MMCLASLVCMGLASAATPALPERSVTWARGLVQAPYPVAEMPAEPVLELLRQDFETLERNRSVIKTPMQIGSRTFSSGLGTHSFSRIRLFSPAPVVRFTSWVGVDRNVRTSGGLGSVVFAVEADGKAIYHSRMLTSRDEAERVDLEVGGARLIDLIVEDGGNGSGCDHADWAEATATLEGGATLRLDQVKPGSIPLGTPRFPFSFRLAGKEFDSLFETCSRFDEQLPFGINERTLTTWRDPASGLKITWDRIAYSDFPAAEWVLRFENTGDRDTPVIEDIQALDVTFTKPMTPNKCYRVHSMHGGSPDPLQFEPKTDVLAPRESVSLGAGAGRSSTRNAPFFTLETGSGTVVGAVGWSGCWSATFDCVNPSQLRVQAGMEKTHFVLRPGERVRSPRILLLHWDGDRLEANAQFRRLVYIHYTALRQGHDLLPISFCNTCFTRGGGWLNETTAENQISLINAYSKLGLDALLTDAGWFEGGWPEGAGNWTPRKDHYPDGMAPVAAAAKDRGIIYGLWFEPERVMRGTTLHREHPDWVLESGRPNDPTLLANFGMPEVQEYFFNIVKGFMDLPGFRIYRQDFNMDPLPYWRHADSPDRQGITEAKYVAGLYAYWERIAAAWPDGLREECASGGNRFDLETVMHMHIHQKTDYWFDHEVNQASLFALSQYLPNNVVAEHLRDLDDYAFHSVLPCSMGLGWIADDPAFDSTTAKRVLDRFHELKHLFVGAWYPLTRYSREPDQWIASQYHRPDLDEGVILAFRRPESPYASLQVKLHGLTPEAEYVLTHDSGSTDTLTGKELLQSYSIALPTPRQSTAIVYRRTR